MTPRIYLDEFAPRSNLVVEEHIVTKPRFEVIDAHTHCGELFAGPNFEELFDTEEFVGRYRAMGVSHVVNLDAMYGAHIDRFLKKVAGFEDFFINFGTVEVSRLDEPDFEHYVYHTLSEIVEKGCKGIKLWKNISLVLRDRKGRHIPVDDPRLAPIFRYAGELGLIVLIHIADPVAFFSPVDRFNERVEELVAHPDWSFCAPGLFSFEVLMEQQERLIASNPGTTFIVAHCGSYAENLAAVAAWLDRYPNLYVDLAARLGELGRQPYSAREFLTSYSDRILFGTDSFCYTNPTDHPIYYRALETRDEYFDYGCGALPTQGRWKIYGFQLEDTPLRNIYSQNAKKLFQLMS
jgi:predicted TIM-barrel fold metal-dependent hydrolase